MIAASLGAMPAHAKATDEDINDILAKMQGMPGMENMKVFGADDIERMTKNGDYSAFGGASSQPAFDCEEELKSFYTKYGMEDKLDGIGAACEKWKGKEYKMMAALRKKYKDVITSHQE